MTQSFWCSTLTQSILPYFDDEAEGCEVMLLVPDTVHTNEFLVVSNLTDKTISKVIIKTIKTNFTSILIEECHSEDALTLISRLDSLDWSLSVKVDRFSFILILTGRIKDWRLHISL